MYIVTVILKMSLPSEIPITLRTAELLRLTAIVLQMLIDSCGMLIGPTTLIRAHILPLSVHSEVRVHFVAPHESHILCKIKRRRNIKLSEFTKM